VEATGISFCAASPVDLWVQPHLAWGQIALVVVVAIAVTVVLSVLRFC
jgi:hypothetical protein